MNNLLKGAALVYILIKELLEKHPDIRIRKIVVQEMMYFLERKLSLDFRFSMYHYGPYSELVDIYLNFLENRDFLDIKWDSKSGYSITIKKEQEVNEITKNFEKIISDEEKTAIQEVVVKYGEIQPRAVKLSIIATALFMKDNFGVKDSEIVNVIKSVKPQYPYDFIEKTLNEAFQ